MNIRADIDVLDVAVAAAHGVFPVDVAVGAAFPWEEACDLLAAEEASMPNGTDRRQREFAGGRRAVHQAMISLGVATRPVACLPDRSPDWPVGLSGSITHSDNICLAAVARSGMYRAIGIDIEDDDDLPPDLVPEICTPDEQAWLSVQDTALRGRLARLIFSAKECAYKAQYSVNQTLIGFDMLDITPDLETGQFEATFTHSVPGFPERSCLTGRFSFASGIILTGMALPGGHCEPKHTIRS